MRPAKRNAGDFLAANHVIIQRQRGIITLALKEKRLALKCAFKTLADKGIINNGNCPRHVNL